MKLLVFACCVVSIGFVAKVTCLPHHGHDHGDQKHDHLNHTKHEHQHSNHTHTLDGTASHDHNETTDQLKDHMNVCHQEPTPVECSDNLKGRWVFKHTNTSHHECVQLDDGKCSSSLNSFISEECCKKSCHHSDGDDHKIDSKIV